MTAGEVIATIALALVAFLIAPLGIVISLYRISFKARLNREPPLLKPSQKQK